jgi:hypothetical protein
MRGQAMLRRGRALAEELMTDTCTIGHERESDTEIDPDTGQYAMVIDEVVYSGPCQFKAGTTAATEINAAGQLLVEQDATVKLPVGEHPAITSGSSAAVEKNMTVVVLASATDPAMVGTRARIQGPFASSYTTARRFPAEITS